MNLSLISDPLSTISKARWQWNSKSDPRSKSKESHWKDYSLWKNYLIEKAYYDQQNEIDLGKYIISLKEMIQIKKSNSKYQRQIRRIDWIENIDFETELPKSINKKMSGSLENLIDFLSKRNQEISEFCAHFTALENSPWDNENNLNQFIIPSLIDCLQKEFIQKPETQLEKPLISSSAKELLLKMKERNEELISLFKRKFSSFEEFYKQILKAYMLNTDLSSNLNKSLRDENWSEIDNLLPLLFCFCKAFFQSQAENKGNSIFLYMGTALEESARKAFDTREIRYFSWYSATSTSSSWKIAEEFMFKSADVQNKKFPVMFHIEIPMTNEPMNYSVSPKEKEVILAPGSVFELQEVSTERNLMTNIKLKLMNKTQALAEKEEIIKRASFQENIMKIICLEGRELNEILRSLSENQLIKELEFNLCIFDNKSLGVMVKTIQTLEKIEALKFISCNFQDKGEFFNEENKDFLLSKIEIDEINNFCQIFGEGKPLRPAAREFHLNIRNKNFQFKELGNLTQLTSLSLDFDWFSQTFDGLENLTQLISLSLTFSNNQANDFPIFILQCLTKLRSLALNFKGDQQIKDDIMHLLFSNLAQIESLALIFSGNNLITDDLMKNGVFLGLQQLTQLNSLTLNFQGCQQLTDEGVEILAAQGLIHLKKLTLLTLNFSGCQQITEEGIKSLSQSQSTDIKFQQAFKPPSPLQLKFQLSSQKQSHFQEENKEFLAVAQRTLEIQNNLNSKLLTKSEFLITQHLVELANFLPPTGLIPHKEISNRLSQVKFLHLNFANITDEILQILASQRFKKLTQLISFGLNFTCSQRITDKGIMILTSEGLRYLNKLEWLSIRFDKCNKITDKGIEFLADKGLRFMTRLNHLALEFSPETKIEEELETVPLIKSKTLAQITDHGINCLVFYGLRNLPKLKSLTLHFQGYSQITNNIIWILAYEGLRFLPELIWLSINFMECDQITDEGIKKLVLHGLKYLHKLKSLALNFQGCQRITDEGVCVLAYDGFRCLNQLRELKLSFSGYQEITDEGVNCLIFQLVKHLTQLKSLTFDFDFCERITEFIISNILKVLAFIGFSSRKEEEVFEKFDEQVNSEEKDMI